MPYLIQKQSDGSTIQQWDLRNKSLTFGRGADVDVSLDDKEISHKHFTIESSDKGYVIRDLKSTNGTWVNGQRVPETMLKPNDRIRAGKTLFVFVEGMSTIISQLEKGDTGYGTYVAELAEKKKKKK